MGANYADRLRELHRDDPIEVRRICARISAIDRDYPIFDIDSLERWQNGRVVLAGDAAHAVSPHSGQGASMAIEDAIAMAQCLDETPYVGSAFEPVVNEPTL